MENWNFYAYKSFNKLCPWHKDFDMTGVRVSENDKISGCPKEGDFIVKSTKDETKMWLIDGDTLDSKIHIWDESK